MRLFAERQLLCVCIRCCLSICCFTEVTGHIVTAMLGRYLEGNKKRGDVFNRAVCTDVL